MDNAIVRAKVARTVGAAALLVATGSAALATFVILVLPNAVEVGPSKAVFFDCGTALSPSTVPAQEPGYSRFGLRCDVGFGAATTAVHWYGYGLPGGQRPWGFLP